jgi:putative endonuclease
MTRKSQSLGKTGEKLAESYLQTRGYTIIVHNYRLRLGEIDIIADDGGTLVFVEVKTRVGTRFGPPFESVTLHKQRQMSKVALEYIGRHGLADRKARFDVVGVLFPAGETSPSRPPKIEVLKDAFNLCYGV